MGYRRMDAQDLWADSRLKLGKLGTLLHTRRLLVLEFGASPNPATH